MNYSSPERTKSEPTNSKLVTGEVKYFFSHVQLLAIAIIQVRRQFKRKNIPPFYPFINRIGMQLVVVFELDTEKTSSTGEPPFWILFRPQVVTVSFGSV